MAEKIRAGTISCTTLTAEIVEKLKEQGYEITQEAELTKPKETENG